MISFWSFVAGVAFCLLLELLALFTWMYWEARPWLK